MQLPAKPEPVPIRILTHNIRYATNAPFQGEEVWEVRCPKLCSELIFNTSSTASAFICLQEVLDSQLNDIIAALTTSSDVYGDWAYVGVGRDDGKRAGEYSPIFYRPAIWKLLSWKTTWLSETPKVPSKGWDAASVRIVTVANFEHQESGKEVVVMSTHLDDQGLVSRKKSAELIVNLAEKVRDGGSGTPILLGGDFNSPPDDEAYLVMTRSGYMKDTRFIVPEKKRYGNEMTFTSFGEPGAVSTRIDFIFCSDEKELSPISFGVLANRFDDGVYNSDHRAVVADFTLT